MKKGALKTYSLEEITDKHIGKPGTPKREAFENELRLDLLGEAIRQARLERNLTQEELGQVAFHFLANRANFHPQEKSHHYLLWKVSSLSARADVIVKTSEQFRSKFGSNIATYKYH